MGWAQGVLKFSRALQPLLRSNGLAPSIRAQAAPSFPPGPPSTLPPCHHHFLTWSIWGDTAEVDIAVFGEETTCGRAGPRPQYGPWHTAWGGQPAGKDTFPPDLRALKSQGLLKHFRFSPAFFASGSFAATVSCTPCYPFLVWGIVFVLCFIWRCSLTDFFHHMGGKGKFLSSSRHRSIFICPYA